MSTKFTFMYADASNYKSYGEVVFAGGLTDEERAAFVDALDEGCYFIAEQVGLTNPREELTRFSSGRVTDDDHVWCTAGDGYEDGFEFGMFPVTDPRSASQFVSEVVAAASGPGGWDVARWAAELESNDTDGDLLEDDGLFGLLLADGVPV